MEVGVDRYHRFGGAVIQSGGQREFLAEITRQLDYFNPRVAGIVVFQNFIGCIGAAVVDAYDFVVVGDRSKNWRNLVKEELGDVFLIEHGNDNAQFRRVGWKMFIGHVMFNSS